MSEKYKNCKRLEAAIREHREDYPRNVGKYKDGVYYGLTLALQLLTSDSEVPAADVEPVVRGEWKPWDTDDGCYQIGWRCSNCQKTRMGDIGKFCPECGAHMERSGSGE